MEILTVDFQKKVKYKKGTGKYLSLQNTLINFAYVELVDCSATTTAAIAAAPIATVVDTAAAAPAAPDAAAVDPAAPALPLAPLAADDCANEGADNDKTKANVAIILKIRIS